MQELVSHLNSTSNIGGCTKQLLHKLLFDKQQRPDWKKNGCEWRAWNTDRGWQRIPEWGFHFLPRRLLEDFNYGKRSANDQKLPMTTAMTKMPGWANPTAARRIPNAAQLGTTAISTPDDNCSTMAKKNTFLRPHLNPRSFSITSTYSTKHLPEEVEQKTKINGTTANAVQTSSHSYIPRLQQRNPHCDVKLQTSDTKSITRKCSKALLARIFFVKFTQLISQMCVAHIKRQHVLLTDLLESRRLATLPFARCNKPTVWRP